MKANRWIVVVLGSLLFWQCSTQNEIATNYYADGIYYDPLYGDLLAMKNPVVEDQPQYADDDYVTGAARDEQFFSNGSRNNFGRNMNMGMGFGMGCSPWGMNSMMSMNMMWGSPGMMMNPWMMNSMMMNPWMMNPWMMNPWMMDPWMMSSMRMNPWMMNSMMMNPWMMNPWMSPYGMGYNPYGFGNDYGQSFNNRRTPDVIVAGGSTPRGNRSSTGLPNKGSNGEAKRGNSIANPNANGVTELASSPQRLSASESRVRQATETLAPTAQRQRVTELSSARMNSTSRNAEVQNSLYQKASRSEPQSTGVRRSVTDSYVNPRTVQRSNAQNNTSQSSATRGAQGNTVQRSNTATRGSSNNSTLQNQSQRVIQNSAPAQRTNSNSGSTGRSYQSSPAPSRTYNAPSGGAMRSAPSGGASRPASSGGAARPSSGGSRR